MKLVFEAVGAQARHIDILYDLLKRRAHKISHQTLPSYADHADFVANHPYRGWFIISDETGPVGSVYVTQQNTIGINLDEGKARDCVGPILDKIKSEFEPLPPIKSLRAAGFSINVAPGNHELLSALEACGHHVAQVTFSV